MGKFVRATTSGLAGIALAVALVALSEGVRAQAPPSGGLGVIEIRPWADGAGPSHIFWLTGDRFAVVDPLKSQILVYVEGSTSAEFAKDIPSGFSPYRLVRRAAEIAIVDESERWMLRVPRDLRADSRELRPEPLGGRTAHVRRARVVRNNAGAVTLRPAGRAPVKVFFGRRFGAKARSRSKYSSVATIEMAASMRARAFPSKRWSRSASTMRRYRRVDRCSPSDTATTSRHS